MHHQRPQQKPPYHLRSRLAGRCLKTMARQFSHLLGRFRIVDLTRITPIGNRTLPLAPAPATSLTKFVMALMLFGGLVGCAPKTTQFDIVDFRKEGPANHYFQAFDECYYCLDAGGNLNVIARRISTSEDGIQTTQVVHLRTFWMARPGRTRAEDTMINATVSYMIVAWPTGASFEGSGFLSFKENRTKDRLTGKLELSSLTPQRRLGRADRLFERAELRGHLFAKRNGAKVVAILNAMRRLLGPLPPYTPTTNNRDLP